VLKGYDCKWQRLDFSITGEIPEAIDQNLVVEVLPEGLWELIDDQ
jgi:hypothetical protein